jgi:hypothetical protein
MIGIGAPSAVLIEAMALPAKRMRAMSSGEF